MEDELEATTSEQDAAEPPNFKVRKQFLTKLFNLLEENRYPEIICWVEGGEKFVIKNPALCAKHILPKLFNHSNYSSFTRQLSFYRFKRASDKADSRIYYHNNFIQGRLDLLDQIERAKHAPPSKTQKEKVKAPKENFEYERVQYLSRINSLTEQFEAAKEYIQELEDENTKLKVQLKEELERDYKARELLASLESSCCAKKPKFLERSKGKPTQQTYINHDYPTLPNSNNSSFITLPQPPKIAPLLQKNVMKGYEVKTQNLSHLALNPQKPRYLYKQASQETLPKTSSMENYQDTLQNFDSSFMHTDEEDFFMSANLTDEPPLRDDYFDTFGGFHNTSVPVFAVNRQK